MDDPLCALQYIEMQRAAEEREAGQRQSDEGLAAGDLQLEAKDRRNIHWQCCVGYRVDWVTRFSYLV